MRRNEWITISDGIRRVHKCINWVQRNRLSFEEITVENSSIENLNNADWVFIPVCLYLNLEQKEIRTNIEHFKSLEMLN